MKTIKNGIGPVIKELRLEAKKSQEDLADELATATIAISQILTMAKLIRAPKQPLKFLIRWGMN